MKKDKEFYNKCKEILQILGDKDYEYFELDNGCIEEYNINDGIKELCGVYENYYDALMSWQETERTFLLHNHVILTRSEYEILGLLPEYLQVIRTRDQYLSNNEMSYLDMDTVFDI